MKRMKDRIVHTFVCLSLAASMSVPAFASGSGLSDADVELIAKVIEHEAGCESLEGRIAVGNVILNRVNDASFPDTVSGVVYQKNQFANFEYSVPDETSWLAAQMAIEGTNVVPDAYWFNGAKARGFKFAQKLCVIGNQAFYGRK